MSGGARDKRARARTCTVVTLKRPGCARTHTHTVNAASCASPLPPCPADDLEDLVLHGISVSGAWPAEIAEGGDDDDKLSVVVMPSGIDS